MANNSENSGARANQGFGAPGSKNEQARGNDDNPPAPEDEMSKRKPDDGLDPQALEKAVKSEGEMIADEQIREDLAVTGAPPKDERPKQTKI